ncbi:MAG: ABC transporter substrate-binding protein [Actinomycetota bacterium]
MFGTRNRLLIALFAVQLVASLAFGVVVVREAGRRSGTGTVALTQAQSGQGDAGSEAAPTSGPSSEPTAAGERASDAGGKTATSRPANLATQSLGVSKDAIKVGVLVTQRGAINFQAAAQASKAYFDHVNEQGGVNGRRIVAIYADDELDSAKGLAAINKMINDDKVFAFAAWNAPMTEQYSVPIIEENKIPLVGCYGTYQQYKSPWVYSFEPFYYQWGLAMSSYVVDRGGKVPAVIYVDNANADSNGGLERGFKDGFAKRGLTLKSDQIYRVDPTNPDFTQQAASMRQGGVDSVATILDQTAYVRLQLALNRQQYHPIHVADPMVVDPGAINDPNVGASLEGTYIASDIEYLVSQNPEVQLYPEQVKRRFGSKALINWSGEVSWLGAKMFVEGLERAGATPTRQGLMDALNSLVDFPTGFTPPLTIRPGPHMPNHCFKLAKIVNKKPEPLTDWLCVPAGLPS